jgi:hypothetical protein
MQTITLEVRDDDVEKIIAFLKLLPENVAKINLNHQNQSYLSDELISRVDDLNNKKVKTISRDELFNDI